MHALIILYALKSHRNKLSHSNFEKFILLKANNYFNIMMKLPYFFTLVFPFVF